MTDPITRPGNDDAAIEDVTEHVVETWKDATPGKDPDAEAGDFARMREGFGRLAGRPDDDEGGSAA